MAVFKFSDNSKHDSNTINFCTVAQINCPHSQIYSFLFWQFKYGDYILIEGLEFFVKLRASLSWRRNVELIEPFSFRVKITVPFSLDGFTIVTDLKKSHKD